MPLRNLPTAAAESLAGLIACHEGQVSSMALATAGSAASITLLAFAAGESVSEESYSADMLYYLVEGRAQVALPEARVPMTAGDVLRVPVGVLHAVESAGVPFKLLQVAVP